MCHPEKTTLFEKLSLNCIKSKSYGNKIRLFFRQVLSHVATILYRCLPVWYIWVSALGRLAWLYELNRCCLSDVMFHLIHCTGSAFTLYLNPYLLARFIKVDIYNVAVLYTLQNPYLDVLFISYIYHTITKITNKQTVTHLCSLKKVTR